MTTAMQDPADVLSGVDVHAEYAKAILVDDIVDPYPAYDSLRADSPVQPVDLLTDFFGLPYSMAAPNGDRPVFSLLSHQAVSQALRDPRTFSSSLLQETIGRVQGRNLIMVDPPEHTRMRSLIQSTFTKVHIERWEREVIAPVVDSLFGALVPRLGGDLMTDVAVVLPVWVIHRIIGLPDDQLDQFHDLAVGLQLIKTRPDLAMASTEILADLLRSIIREHRAVPGDTTIDVLIQAQMDGQEPLSDEEILGFLRVLLPAGGETTTRNLGSLVTALVANPDQLELLRADRALMGAAIDEALRWESPTQFTYRIATRDVEVCGVDIPAGAGLNLCVGAANRDPAKFPDPGHFDLTRATRGHVAFGQGVHMCIGQHLARTEVRLATDAVLDRLVGLRFDPDAGPPVVRGSTFRWPPQVQVIWDA